MSILLSLNPSVFTMASTVASFLTFLIAGTIITGALNSIFTKFQDLQCVSGCDTPGKERFFEAPVLQTIQMFIGEMLCWIPVASGKFLGRKVRRPEQDEVQTDASATTNELRPLISEHETGVSKDKKKVSDFKTSLLLAIPSTCDLLGTTLMNAGLLYTQVSIYQMTRGSIILFVGLFSVVFLGRKINRIEWASLFVVFAGVFLVGLSGWLSELNTESLYTVSATKFTAGQTLFGISLIFVGIMFSAFQFVAEESILTKIEVRPLELVGWEGLYGWLVSFGVAIFAYILVGSRESGKEGQWDIIYEIEIMFENKSILISSLLIMLSISSFNFFGISLTENLSATARSTIDTSRTLLVWIISICIGWESFKWLQLFAFFLMVFGTLVFNGAVVIDDWKYLPSFLRVDEPTKDSILEDDVEANLNRR